MQIGRESFIPQQRFLSEDESFAVTVEFCLRHPARLSVIRRVLGWDLRTDAAIREFVQTHPFVAFRPDDHRVTASARARCAVRLYRGMEGQSTLEGEGDESL